MAFFGIDFSLYAIVTISEKYCNGALVPSTCLITLAHNNTMAASRTQNKALGGLHHVLPKIFLISPDRSMQGKQAYTLSKKEQKKSFPF